MQADEDVSMEEAWQEADDTFGGDDDPPLDFGMAVAEDDSGGVLPFCLHCEEVMVAMTPIS